jgi:hypothetical protein
MNNRKHSHTIHLSGKRDGQGRSYSLKPQKVGNGGLNLERGGIFFSPRWVGIARILWQA